MRRVCCPLNILAARWASRSDPPTLYLQLEHFFPPRWQARRINVKRAALGRSAILFFGLQLGDEIQRQDILVGRLKPGHRAELGARVRQDAKRVRAPVLMAKSRTVAAPLKRCA
jgi:hypothetical protein